MPELQMLEKVLAGAHVDPSVWAPARTFSSIWSSGIDGLRP